jgi:hypothetical protein
MRYSFGLILAAVLGVFALSPSESQAGPFVYRGGGWDRWVAPVLNGGYDGYWYNGYYYPSNSYYYPSGYTTYYYPTTTYVAPTTTYYYPSSYYYPSTYWSSSYYPGSFYYDYGTPIIYGRGRMRWR